MCRAVSDRRKKESLQQESDKNIGGSVCEKQMKPQHDGNILMLVDISMLLQIYLFLKCDMAVL